MSTLDLFSLWKNVTPKRFKKQLMVAWYNAVARFDREGDLLFMNHGYQLGTELLLPPELEPFRYPIQLYDLLGREVDWTGKDALEVSSGLGGGTVWIWRHYRPRSLNGLDIAPQQVKKCQQRFSLFGIDYTTGDAQSMPFPDAGFDIVVNIESSLNYPDFSAFLNEVLRVLRPGGHFLFADYRRSDKLPRLRMKLTNSGMETIWLRDITRGITAGMEMEDLRKADLIARRIPRPFVRSAMNFAGLGTGNFNEKQQFATGKKSYLAGVLRKPRLQNDHNLNPSAARSLVE
ncbi:MAG: class I SAM-dependent methyltransferase [Pseudomonadota bacterium]